MSPKPANDLKNQPLELPRTPASRLTQPFRQFFHIEASSGIVLIAFTILALILANSNFRASFLHLWETSCAVVIGTWELRMDLLHVINDGLMVIFFFVVGLEIKRELIAGELKEPRKAALPVFAALGGMLLPALLFYGASRWLGLSAELSKAWAIPMATDIAFVVGVMALFGKRIPQGMKILMLSLAIVDDLGAILVIAFVFTEQLHGSALLIAGAGFGLTYALNRLGVRTIPIYVIVGAVIWYFVHESGVHATVAGVLLGLMTPASAWLGDTSLQKALQDLQHRLKNKLNHHEQHDSWQKTLNQTQFVAREVMSPLQRLETGLHPWVAFGIMPLFAFANAGVAIESQAVWDPLVLAIILGLVVGKPVGIVGFSYCAIRLGLAERPTGVSWRMFWGGACLGGIGFTMALFLANLSLPIANLPAGKIGILIGSVLSTLLGMILLILSFRTSPNPSSDEETPPTDTNALADKS